ncbi:hypothetical protein [Zymomonas mobilis]
MSEPVAATELFLFQSTLMMKKIQKKFLSKERDRGILVAVFFTRQE